jgi:sigma-E factor negative regulatory protein RseC
VIKQQAKVISADNDVVWVEAERRSTCSACKARKGCGTGMLSEHVGKRFSQLRVDKTTSVTVGQDIQIAIPEEALLEGAFLMYIVPLIVMFFTAALAHFFQLNQFFEIIFGLTGLSVGFYWVRQKMRTKTDGFKAYILEE